jgi:hypothetical protein
MLRHVADHEKGGCEELTAPNPIHDAAPDGSLARFTVKPETLLDFGMKPLEIFT